MIDDCSAYCKCLVYYKNASGVTGTKHLHDPHIVNDAVKVNGGYHNT